MINAKSQLWYYGKTTHTVCTQIVWHNVDDYAICWVHRPLQCRHSLHRVHFESKNFNLN